MITLRVLRLLLFLVHNINDGIETKEEVLAFIRKLDDLSEHERTFLEAAFYTSSRMTASG